MTKKNEKTASTEEAAEEVSNYSPIYLVLNGNNITVNNYYLNTAIEQAQEYGVPLYVTSNAGQPGNPPPCPPAFPKCYG